MKELWWEDKDIVSLMIRLISKKLSLQDFKNSHIYLTALSDLLTKWLHHSNIIISARWSSYFYNYLFFHTLISQHHHCVAMISSWCDNLAMSLFFQFDKTHISVLLCSSIHYTLIYSTTTLSSQLFFYNSLQLLHVSSSSLLIFTHTILVHISSQYIHTISAMSSRKMTSLSLW